MSADEALSVDIDEARAKMMAIAKILLVFAFSRHSFVPRSVSSYSRARSPPIPTVSLQYLVHLALPLRIVSQNFKLISRKNIVTPIV
jgi:hypothetical protein